jgi:hypothetical protein
LRFVDLEPERYEESEVLQACRKLCPMQVMMREMIQAMDWSRAQARNIAVRISFVDRSDLTVLASVVRSLSVGPEAWRNDLT